MERADGALMESSTFAATAAKVPARSQKIALRLLNLASFCASPLQ
jgi:hypothetical protein